MEGTGNKRLPPTPHTLAEFNKRALALYDIPLYDFIKFTLTGVYQHGKPDDSSGPEKQALIHLDGHSATPNHDLLISRYYGTGYGISRNILVDVPIKLHSHSPYLCALEAPISVQRQVEHQDLVYSVDYNRIPNFELGVFGETNTLHIFFPRLWSPERDQQPLPRRLSSAEYELWFTRGFSPALCNLRIQVYMEEDIWPSHMGSSVAVPVASRLMEEVRSCLSSHINLPDWARDFVVMHIVKGVRHTPPYGMESSELSLNHFLCASGLHHSAPDNGEWYMDVGIEVVSRQRLCLQWKTAAHSTLAREALQSVDDVDAAGLTQCGTKRYQRLMANNLSAVSGFRMFPGARFPGYKVVRACTSDEDLFVGTHDSHTITADEVLSQGPPFCNAPPTIDRLIKLSATAREENPSKARLEVRVPLPHASSVFLNVDPTAITESLYVFERKDWWDFRITRLVAIREALMVQSRDTDRRFLPENLTLTAALIWLANDCTKHHDTAPTPRAFMDAILPATEKVDTTTRDHSDTPNSITAVGDAALEPLGCIFLRKLASGTAAQPALSFFPGGTALLRKHFRALFNGMTPEDLEARYKGST